MTIDFFYFGGNPPAGHLPAGHCTPSMTIDFFYFGGNPPAGQPTSGTTRQQDNLPVGQPAIYDNRFFLFWRKPANPPAGQPASGTNRHRDNPPAGHPAAGHLTPSMTIDFFYFGQWDNPPAGHCTPSMTIDVFLFYIRVFPKD